MSQTLQCYKCGTQNALGMRFCTVCGEKFLYKCPECGTNIEPGSAYCTGCAARLNWGGAGTERTEGISSELTGLAEVKQKEGQRDEVKKKDPPERQRGLSPWLIAFIIVVFLIIAVFVVDAILF